MKFPMDDQGEVPDMLRCDWCGEWQPSDDGDWKIVVDEWVCGRCQGSVR